MKGNEHITREQLDKVADILKLGRIKYSETNAIMRCPFYKGRKHNFIVDMTTGEYHYNYCGEVGHIRDLGIIIGASILYDIEDMEQHFSRPYSNEDGTGIMFPFKKSNLNKILSLTRLAPSLIMEQIDNKDNFCLIYYFSNLKMDTDHYNLVFLRLYHDFKDVMSTLVPSDNEILKNYRNIRANAVYRVIDYYTDEQINSLISLFDEGGTNNGKDK